MRTSARRRYLQSNGHCPQLFPTCRTTAFLPSTTSSPTTKNTTSAVSGTMDGLEGNRDGTNDRRGMWCRRTASGSRVIVAAAVIDALASLDLHYPEVGAAKRRTGAAKATLLGGKWRKREARILLSQCYPWASQRCLWVTRCGAVRTATTMLTARTMKPAGSTGRP